jgi:hypothetical protein
MSDTAVQIKLKFGHSAVYSYPQMAQKHADSIKPDCTDNEDFSLLRSAISL